MPEPIQDKKKRRKPWSTIDQAKRLIEGEAVEIEPGFWEEIYEHFMDMTNHRWHQLTWTFRNGVVTVQKHGFR